MSEHKGSLIRTFWTIPIFFPTTVVLSLVIIVLAPFGLMTPRFARGISRLWAGQVLALCGVKIEFIGVENLPPEGGCIIAANHSSAFDIPILMRLPVHICWLAKDTLFKIPFMGQAMRAVGHIPVHRQESSKALGLLKAAARRINAGATVAIFPEGTRTRDGKLLPFKKGGFLLARLAKRPLVPVAIIGSMDRLPSKSLRPAPGRVTVRIGRPIDPAEFPGRNIDDLSQAVRQALQGLLDQGQAGENGV